MSGAQRLEGRCLCGAVRLACEARELDACHCGMCRRLNAGPAFALDAGGAVEVLAGADHVKTYASSDWAERAFCGVCGTALWYRLTADGPAKGFTVPMAGPFDNLDGVPFAKEIFIDDKPHWYAFAGERPRLTGKQTVAMFQSDGDA